MMMGRGGGYEQESYDSRQVKQDASRFARVPAVYVHAMLTCELVAFLISPDK